MITFTGHYFDGRQPIDLPARMDVSDQEAVLTVGALSERYARSDLKVSPRSGAADRFILLPTGAQFSCADDLFLDSLPQESSSEGPVAWLEERWKVALACIVATVGILCAAYFFGLPAAAGRIAAHIPMETEQTVGRQALTWLDNHAYFTPTELDVSTQKEIRDGFGGLSAGLPFRKHYRLMFRSGGSFGANAFAFPGGTIIITDDMVKAAETNEEVLAILAHEIGHMELRHTMRSVLQNSIVAAAVAAVTSDAASLNVAVSGLPVLLVQRKYSREFEFEADDYAFGLLKRKGLSPMSFASIMERLAKGKGEETKGFTYISTHPLTAERVQGARDAALR